MLDEISSESLTTLLTDVRSLTKSSRLHAHDHGSFLIPGHVMEIQGGPSSGKTHLLYHLLLVCIAPSVHNSIFLEGWGKAAIVFDMDHSFDINRLYQLLLARLTNSLAGDVPTANYLALQALTKLHIFQPSSTSQLAVTILHLPNYHSTHLADQEIGMIAIDSVGAYYWPDRFLVEQIQPSSSTSNEYRRDTPIYSSPLEQVLLALESFRRTYRPTIIMTNWGLYSVGDTNPPLYKQHLQPFPAPFPHSRPAANKQPLSAYHDNLLKLTIHITLHQDIDVMSACLTEKHIPHTQQTRATGLIRIPNISSIAKFTLYINADSITVDNHSFLE